MAPPSVRFLLVAFAAVGLLAAALLASTLASPGVPAPPLAVATPTPGPEGTPTPERMRAERVVYVSRDFTIFTVNRDGTGTLRIAGGSSETSGGVQARPQPQQRDGPFYSWPTWAPDGGQLAVSRAPGPASGTVAALALLTPPSLRESYVHRTFDGPLDRVADGTFHYVQWSPDSRRLAFIAPNREGTALTLYEALPEGSQESSGARTIVDTAPIYFMWSLDSSRMLLHRRESLVLMRENGSLEDLGRDSFAYRVPAFSPDGSTIAYVAGEGDEARLTVRNLDGPDERALWEVPTETAFAWSPTDATKLAAVRRAEDRFFTYDGVYLLDPSSREARELYGGDVVSFFWSPDGSKLAVVATRSDDDSLRWLIIDAATGETNAVGDFIPTGEFRTYLQFFDQFILSHPVWSSDSRTVLFAGRLVAPGLPLRRQPEQLWVLDTEGDVEPISLGQGRLGFFVPAGVP